MPGFDINEVIAAYKAGADIKRQKEEHAQRTEERKLQMQILSHQKDRLKIQDALENRAAANQNFDLMNGQPGQERQLSAPVATPSTYPGQEGSFNPGTPEGTQTVVQPHAPVSIPGIEALGIPGVTRQPQTAQAMLAQKQQEQLHSAMQGVQLKGLEPYNIPDGGTHVTPSLSGGAPTVVDNPKTPPAPPAIIQEVRTVTTNFDNLPPAGKMQAIADYVRKKGAEPSVDQQSLDAYLSANPGKSAFDYTMQKAAAGRAVSGDARLDKSYQFHVAQLSSLAKPIDDAVARMGRLEDTLNQNTPQADALVAPELLTVMAGGVGSGLRMNEAEIARIVGGRTNFEGLKAALNKWQLDPAKGLSITPAQREQVRQLVKEVGGKLLAKQEALTQAGQTVVDAPTVNGHRQALADVKKMMRDIDNGKAAGKTGLEHLSTEELLQQLVPKVK